MRVWLATTIGGGIPGIHGFHGPQGHFPLDTFLFHRPAMVDQYPDIGPGTAITGLGNLRMGSGIVNDVWFGGGLV